MIVCGKSGRRLTWDWWVAIRSLLALFMFAAVVVAPHVAQRAHAESGLSFENAPAMRFPPFVLSLLSRLRQANETAIVLTARALKKGPGYLPDWDPGFGPHEQTACHDPKVKAALKCWPPALVCCDVCKLCTCEPDKRRCPVIGMMDRRYCRPGFTWEEDE